MPGPATTPNRSYRYATGDDAASDIDLRMQQLATDVDADVQTIATSITAIQATQNGFDFKGSARAKSTGALPAYTRVGSVLTANANGALAAQDTTVTLIVGDRYLLTDGAAGADNGLYVVTAVGSGGAPWVLTRASDADASAEMTPGAYIVIEEGTLYGDTGWLLTTNGPITLNTTALTFTQFPPAPVDPTSIAITYAIALGG